METDNTIEQQEIMYIHNTLAIPDKTYGMFNAEVFYKGTKIMDIETVFQLNELRIQIKGMKKEGFYIILNGTQINITAEGRIPTKGKIDNCPLNIFTEQLEKLFDI